MRDDLVKFDERDRKFIRYFTLTHFANAGAAASDIEGFRQGLSKLVNSLSWGRKIVPPKPIDPAQTILRINLNDYDWDEKTWDSVVAQYPFDVSYKTLAAKETYEMTQTAHPVVRGDWFVNTASRPPLYHTILKMPTNDRDLEKELRIDSGEDIRKELVHRAGFNGSGVSQNNRLLERHRTGFRTIGEAMTSLIIWIKKTSFNTRSAQAMLRISFSRMAAKSFSTCPINCRPTC